MIVGEKTNVGEIWGGCVGCSLEQGPEPGSALPVYDESVKKLIRESLPKTSQLVAKLRDKTSWVKKAMENVVALLTGRNIWREKYLQTLEARRALEQAGAQLAALAETMLKHIEAGMAVDPVDAANLRESIKEVRQQIPTVYGMFLWYGCYNRPKWIDYYVKPPRFPWRDIALKWVEAIRKKKPVPAEIPTLGDPRKKRSKAQKCRERIAAAANGLRKLIADLDEAERKAVMVLRALGKPTPPAPAPPPPAPAPPPVVEKPKIPGWVIPVAAGAGLLFLMFALRR